MSNKNSENLKNSDNCNYCNYCDSCYYCNSCNYCDSCNSCNYCDSCDSCYYCNSCNYCDSCDSCYYCNSCNYSYGLRMSEYMLFCLGEGRFTSSGEGYQKNHRIFNKDVSEEIYNKAINSRPSFELPIAKWIDKKDMTEQEKKDYKIYSEIGGYLKTLSYQDAWKEGWSKASDEFKKWVRELPNYDEEIFTKITGIEKPFDDSLSGSEVSVTIKGKTYTAVIK